MSASQKQHPALEQADIVVVLVDHDEFKNVAPEAIAGKTVIDTRGIWRAGTERDLLVTAAAAAL
jgi:UDP-N-acetyl-D-mannosaminuronate dehydrogenase